MEETQSEMLTTHWDHAIEVLDSNLVKRAEEILSKDTDVLKEHWVKVYKADAQKFWNIFYRRNQMHFFKDRHWTYREFPELLVKGDEMKFLLEVGCGSGNLMFPLLELQSNIFIYACDFSQKAISIVKENPLYSTNRCSAFIADLTDNDSFNTMPLEPLDFVSMIFVLSAIPPEKMQNAINNVAKLLKPGGKILFRDYGIYDHAQLRFKRGHKLHTKCYVRQDGTLSYYFSIDELKKLFISSGLLDVEECGYIMRETINRKKEMKVDRVFIQARAIRKEIP
ncbi:Methyltransferase-like protein 6 [Coelomomyces lativittatus]|nr:Methyltransferase-like protein 6 [Coelomomyces lativittatus]